MYWFEDAEYKNNMKRRHKSLYNIKADHKKIL